MAGSRVTTREIPQCTEIRLTWYLSNGWACECICDEILQWVNMLYFDVADEYVGYVLVNSFVIDR